MPYKDKIALGRKKKETCHRNVFRAAGSTCVLIEYRVIGCIFSEQISRLYPAKIAQFIVPLIVWKKKDSGRKHPVYKKSREYIRFVEGYLSFFLGTSGAKFLRDAISISSVKDRQKPA